MTSQYHLEVVVIQRRVTSSHPGNSLCFHSGDQPERAYITSTGMHTRLIRNASTPWRAARLFSSKAEPLTLDTINPKVWLPRKFAPKSRLLLLGP
eukprot:821505-Amorphochlora_amoeboformis.AAC.1